MTVRIAEEDRLAFRQALGNMVRYLFRKSNTVHLPRQLARIMAFYTAATVFSALYLVAWNWDFPSPTIRILWRSFGLAAMSTGPLTIYFNVAMISIPSSFFCKVFAIIFQVPNIAIIILLQIVYVISRLGRIVLIFYCFLRCLQAYMRRWTGQISSLTFREKALYKAQLCLRLMSI
jgi:hypothetical protein